MSKYSFLIHHSEFHQFVETLQHTGVVHIKEKAEGVSHSEEVLSNIKLLKKIEEIKKYLKARKIDQTTNKGELNANEIIEKIEEIQNTLEQKNTELQSVNKKINQLKPWGNFSWQTIENLEKAGKKINFYTCNRSKYKPEWANKFELFELNRLESLVYFIVISDNNLNPDIQADLVKLPSENYREVINQAQEITTTLNKLNQEIHRIANYAEPILTAFSNKIKSETDFKKATLHASDKADSRIKLIEGWIPEEKENHLVSELNKLGILFIKNKPGISDRVPVLLKNNAFNKLFEIIGSLYSLPNYREIDLTPFFAPFFMLFFGFCLGDAGYGLIVMIATLLLRRKAKPDMKPIWTLGFFFGLATVFMGIIGGTFFGIMLVDLNFNWIEGMKRIMLDQNQLMIFAILLGIAQIVFGIFLKAARKMKMDGFRHSLSIIGWLIIIMGAGGSFALGHFDVLSKNITTPLFIGTGTTGAILALFFNSPGKNLLVNFGLGLWDTYSMATGLLGDVLSYIRLFALGLSSAILGNVFNQLAFDLTGNIPVLSQLFTVLILLLGHSINFFMAALGAFVHPLRLTFVEFFKNTGFSGGGMRYEPLRKIDDVKY